MASRRAWKRIVPLVVMIATAFLIGLAGPAAPASQPGLTYASAIAPPTYDGLLQGVADGWPPCGPNGPARCWWHYGSRSPRSAFGAAVSNHRATYHLALDVIHTFYVAPTGADARSAILVHNASPKPCPPMLGANGAKTHGSVTLTMARRISRISR